MSIALLTFDYQPLRFEAHETQRAGLIVVLVVAGLVGFERIQSRRQLSRQSLTLVLAIFGWCFALVLATFFALSPTESVFGDAIRRMGLLTQLCFIGIGLMASLLETNHHLESWFWLSGIVVSSYVLLQFFGIVDQSQNGVRPNGILGVSTFTAGWLSLAWIWIFSSSFNKPIYQFQLIKRVAGMGLMLIAIVLTSSRGASIALLVGTISLVLLRAAYYQQRALARFTLMSVVLLGIICFFLLNFPLNDSRIPLITRFNSSILDDKSSFRNVIWPNALDLVHTWPIITSVYNNDPWSNLRPFIGYGLESFETVYRLKSAVPSWFYSLAPIDRAHNDWLDTLLTTGWTGVLFRMTLYLSICSIALWRLNLFGWRLFALSGGLLLFAGILGAQSPYLPIILTLAALTGLWLWLIWLTHRPLTTNDLKPFDTTAGLAISLLVVHLVEIQFNFVTVTTGLIFWLSVGLLIATHSGSNASYKTIDRQVSVTHLSVWVGLAGALMIRSLLFNQGWFATLLMLSVIWMAAYVLRPEISDNKLILVFLWLFGLVGAFLSSAELAAIWDVSCALLGLMLMGYRVRIGDKIWLDRLRVSLIAIVIWWWARDIAAYIHLKQGQASDYVHQTQIAVSYSGWDIFLRTILSEAASWEATSNRQNIENNTLNLAFTNLEVALKLKPYDAYLVWKLAVLETKSGDIAAANFFYAAAVRMWPTKTEIQQEWDHFRKSELFVSPNK